MRARSAVGIFPHGKDLEGAEVVEGLNGKFFKCARAR